jgi:hypothetical protein
MELCRNLSTYFPAWDMTKPLSGAPVAPPCAAQPHRPAGPASHVMLRLGAYEWLTKHLACTRGLGFLRNCSTPSGDLCRRDLDFHRNFSTLSGDLCRCFPWMLRLPWPVLSGYLSVCVTDTSAGAYWERGEKPGNCLRWQKSKLKTKEI